jgi:pimeloyl-ACP methyl ester carboxylesterase
MERDGSPGRFAEKGFFRDFADELLREGLADRLGGSRSIADVDRVTLVAHSAGFKAALSILQRGGAGAVVRDVVLFDALYAGPAVFGGWVAGAPPGGPGRRLVSLYTRGGPTARMNRRLGESLEGRLGRDQVALDPVGPLAAAVRARRVVVAPTAASHGDVPARHLAEVLSALDLRRRQP